MSTSNQTNENIEDRKKEKEKHELSNSPMGVDSFGWRQMVVHKSIDAMQCIRWDVRLMPSMAAGCTA